MYTYDDEAALNVFKEILPEVDQLTIAEQVNLFENVTHLSIQDMDLYNEWTKVLDDVMAKSLTLVPYLSNTGQLKAVELLISIYHAYDLKNNQSSGDFTYLETAMVIKKYKSSRRIYYIKNGPC